LGGNSKRREQQKQGGRAPHMSLNISAFHCEWDGDPFCWARAAPLHACAPASWLSGKSLSPTFPRLSIRRLIGDARGIKRLACLIQSSQFKERNPSGCSGHTPRGRHSERSVPTQSGTNLSSASLKQRCQQSQSALRDVMLACHRRVDYIRRHHGPPPAN